MEREFFGTDGIRGTANTWPMTAEIAVRAGMAAGFPAGAPNGHQLINNSSDDVVFLEVGNRTPEDVVKYPDMDLMLTKQPGNHQYTDRDGKPIGDKVAGAPGSDDK